MLHHAFDYLYIMFCLTLSFTTDVLNSNCSHPIAALPPVRSAYTRHTDSACLCTAGCLQLPCQLRLEASGPGTAIGTAVCCQQDHPRRPRGSSDQNAESFTQQLYVNHYAVQQQASSRKQDIHTHPLVVVVRNSCAACCAMSGQQL
jgi:hypothetical protein